MSNMDSKNNAVAEAHSNIIRCWRSIEEITPCKIDTVCSNNETIKKVTNAVIGDKELPWLTGKNISTDTYFYYYTFFLGSLSIETVIDEMRDVLGISRKELREEHETDARTCLASFTLDHQGYYNTEKVDVPDYVITLIARIRYGEKYDQKKNYAEIRSKITQEITDVINNRFYGKPPTRITDGILKEINHDIIEFIGIEDDTNLSRVLFSNVAIIYTHMIQTPVANKNSDDKKQEDIIGHRNYFNSFFLSDLKKVELFIQEEKYHNIITKYLSLICEQKQDVRDSNYYQENMIVGNIPPVRWPSKGNHSLALSQMLAVKESLETKDIFSINGPPGTGKTTLLKDIIANLIYSKAVRIAKLKKPVDIFNGKSKNFKVNNYNYLAWELNDDFLDLIAVVASSNNNAVENISDEIPFDIDDDLDIDYFKNEASMIFQNEDNLIWPHGMFSATLGKSENKSKFFGGFWPPDQGDKKKTISFKDTLRNSNVTFSEWEKSRKDFLAKIAEYNELISELELVSEAINKEEELKLTIEKLQVKKQSVENALKDLKNNIKILNNNCSRFVSNIESIKQLIELEIRTSPSLLQKIISLFTGGSVLKDWEDKMSVLKRDLHSDYSNKRNTEESLIEMDTELDNLKYNLNEVKTELDAHTEYYSKLHNIKKKYQEIFLREKLPLPDKNFWQQSEEMIHASSPWIYSGLQNIRSKLFKCSCELIKLTILANSDKFINNINVLKVMNFASLPEEGKEYAKHIWNSFALIIPIISTTFASFANLFKDLGSQEIGCLLIDEAGQTSPHKAVGAMWRAKKVIVVGDPLQIEPVETLPEEIGEKIMQSNGIDNKYNPLSSSIQVFADQSNKIGTYISNDNNVIWVGSPLRVHRRCNDPMFKISNQISYNNLMIHRSNNKKLAIERYFPESLWIDVQNTNATDKYVREEGEIIQQLVNYLIYRGNKLPDLFIISPFKNIADKIKALLANDGIIPAMNITKGEKIKWVNKSVGTVHSFQGKESPIVIIVLGCDKDSLKSASWAASKANILNVALTRAKNMVFVVGNSEIWGKKKYFNLVHDKLSKINVRDFRDKLVL